MKLWVAVTVLCFAVPAHARPGGSAELVMHAGYANVDDPDAAGGLEHPMTIGASLRGLLGGRFLYECAGLDFEIGGSVPGSFVYDTNMYLVGIGARLPQIATLRLCVGGGLSGAYDRVPFSVQAPVEALLWVQLGSHVRLHSWARAAWLATDSRHGGSDAVPSWDELSAGVAIGWTRTSEFRYERAGSSTGYFVGFRYSEFLGTRSLGVSIGYRADAGSI